MAIKKTAASAKTKHQTNAVVKYNSQIEQRINEVENRVYSLESELLQEVKEELRKVKESRQAPATFTLDDDVIAGGTDKEDCGCHKKRSTSGLLLEALAFGTLVVVGISIFRILLRSGSDSDYGYGGHYYES